MLAGHHHILDLGKLLIHLCASVTKQHNLVPAKGRLRSVAGKVMVLAMRHRLSGTFTYGLAAKEREMSTLPIL